MKQLSRSIVVCTAIALALTGIQASHAGSATWNARPASADWNTANNWTPATVPNSASDIASFGVSNNISVSLSISVEVNSIVFNAGASAFTITSVPAKAFTISGSGILNNSEITQNFVVNQDQSGAFKGITFTNSATAGSDTHFTLLGGEPYYGWGGQINFFANSNADHATFDVYGSEKDGLGGGYIEFIDSATAANATFSIHQGPGYDGEVVFGGTATAGSATFNNDGTMFFGTSSQGGQAIITNTNTIFIRNSSDMQDATITNKGELRSGDGNDGYTELTDTVTTGSCIIVNEGGTGVGTLGGPPGFR